MGLDDLIPEGKEDTSSRGRRRTKPDTVSFGSGNLKKEFTEERWEEVKSTLVNEMGLVPNEVVNNYPAQERFDALHEAALLSQQEITPEELKEQPDKCYICGRANMGLIEVKGLDMCASHTVGELQEALDEN